MRSKTWLLLPLLLLILISCAGKAPLQVTLDLNDSTQVTAELYSVEPSLLVVRHSANGVSFPWRIPLDCISQIKVHAEKTHSLAGGIIGTLVGGIIGAFIPVKPGLFSAFATIANVDLGGLLGCIAGAVIGLSIPVRDPVFSPPFKKEFEKLRSYAYFPDWYPDPVDSTYHCR